MNRLIVVTGPTASGKTTLAIELARVLGTEIISADSRQLFRDLSVGTARPTPGEMAAVPHHFVATLGLGDYYSAAQFEEDVLAMLPGLFSRGGGNAVMCGGSMMYVDAVCDGIDRLPTVSDSVRADTLRLYQEEGLDGVIRELERLDPDYLRRAPDLRNHKRLVHALEITVEAGRPYSSMLTGEKKPREFEIVKFAIDHPREVLFDRINRRVELMMEQGLFDEARKVYPFRHLNSLNTVGYKEMFACLDGKWDLPMAVARIQKNTRVYAKKQLTWLRRDPSVIWLSTDLPLLPQVLDVLRGMDAAPGE